MWFHAIHPPSDRQRMALGWAAAVFLHGALTFIAWYPWSDSRTEKQERTFVPAEVVKVEPEPEKTPDVSKKKPVQPPPPPPEEIVDLTKNPTAAEPPPTESASDAKADAKPVFGLGKRSFGKDGAFQVRMGNTVAMSAADSEVTTEVEALKPVPVYSVTELPRILEKPDPNYPATLRSAGIEGDVILEVVVDSEGAVAAAEVVDTTDARFDEAALKAAREVRFRPAKQGQTPVPVKIRLPVRFRLR